MLSPVQTGTTHGLNGFAKPWEDEVFVLPATVGQQGFRYLDQLQPGNPAYNIAVRFRLQGLLQFEHLQRAINEIVRRHESLRTVFTTVDGVPMQVVTPRLNIAIQDHDISGGSEASRHERAQAIAMEEAERPFDLERGPLLRVRLLRLDATEHVLLVTVHHIVSDGWSIGVLSHELGVLYDSYQRGLPSPLPELVIQYGDFAVWQEKWLTGFDMRQQIAYWSRQLADLPTLEAPTDRPRSRIPTHHGMIDSILLPKDLTHRAAELANRENATPFMVMLAAFQLLLQRTAGQNDIYVGSVLAGRSRPELEPLIGLFINPLVFRTDLSGDPPFLDLLARVRQTVLGAFANQDVPFERVVESVRGKRSAAKQLIFQINFLYQRDFVETHRGTDLTITSIPSVSPGAMYDLNFFLVERAEGLRASIEYNPDLYEAATIRRLLGQFQRLLEEISRDPASRFLKLPMEVPTEPDPATPSTNSSDRPHGSQLAQDSYVAPRDAIETQLADIWTRLLGMHRISVTTDFFDVGGHSLLAARLIAQVGKTFNRKLPIAGFLKAPTIESMAARLRERESVASSDYSTVIADVRTNRLVGEWQDPEEQLFPMRGSGMRPPLIIIDAGPFQRPLVRAMESDQPVYGLALPELSDLPSQFTVRDIAANLVHALCASTVEGPYYLAGWSQAGVIAYEMARQLRLLGEDIALLILFDSSNPRYLRGFSGWTKYPIRLFIKLQKVLYHFRKMSGMPLRKGWHYFWERMGRFDLKSIGRPQDPDAPPMDSWKVQYHAVNDSDPEPCDWPVALIRSTVLQTGWFRDPLLGWGEVARGGLQVYEMPGEHDAMFLEPDVRRLAAVVNDVLSKVRGENKRALAQANVTLEL